MSLDGLRAWIGEVERKLGKRTRVFLALCAIAIGIAGAAVYLALDARSDSVSEGDVQELQRELEAQGVGAGTGSADLVQLEAEVQSLQAEVDRLKGNGGSGQGKGGSDQNQGGTGAGGSGGTSGEEGGSDSGSSGASGGVVPEKGNAADLQKLLEEAKRQSEENE